MKKLEIERRKASQAPQAYVQNLLLNHDIIPQRQVVVQPPNIDFTIYESLPKANTEPPKAGDIVRGRTYTVSKPVSFNMPWTFDEQKRLEQLLIEYPDEPTAAYRWEKIARALGNRTPKQVGSRVQKYFIRLAQAGLPVPGRVPNIQVCKKINVN